LRGWLPTTPAWEKPLFGEEGGEKRTSDPQWRSGSFLSLFILTLCSDDRITDDLLVEVRAEEPPTHIGNDCVTDDLLVETETYPRCANGVFFEEVVESSQEMVVQCAFRNVTRWLNALSYQTSGDVSEVLREAFRIADMTFGEEEAVSWGDNFGYLR
jgi:hypothetical protein